MASTDEDLGTSTDIPSIPSGTEPGSLPVPELGTDGSDDAQLPLGQTGPPPPPRVRRRAPRRATAGADALPVEPSEPGSDATSAPAAEQPEPDVTQPPPMLPPATFGLLFQAPEPPAPTRRRASAPAQRVQRRDDHDAAGDHGDQGDQSDPDRDKRDNRAEARGSAGVARQSRPTGDGDVEGVGDGQGDGDFDGDSEAQPRRRRRGGKGRRRSGDETGPDADTTAAPSTPATATATAGATTTTGSASAPTQEQPAGDDGSADAGGDGEAGDDAAGSRKRTRRRRRGGAVGEGEDPPGTVTRVREPKTARDEATGIKGSTRLEAKRQRRREGREAGRRRSVITEAEFLARRESVERVMVVREADGLTQIGVLEDGVLVEHYVARDSATSGSMAGNVYLGRVQNVLPSMEAAFVDIGRGRNAVLYAGEVNWDAAGLEQSRSRRIENALSSGQSVMVQVTKDPIGHKGARLTSQISLPGRYLVYVPEGSMTGISRKLPDTERARLKKVLKEIVPADAGVIVRTAAEGASEAELTADVERLTKVWETIQKKAVGGASPSLLHGEPDLTVRVVRDIFNEDFARLVVSGAQAWTTVSDYVSWVAPDLADRLSRWTDQQDLFSHYRIDEQLAKAMDRKVWLPSGGSLVIDRTEAMTVVDVNTGKFVGSGGNLEETVTKNNIEAAEEIVRQLRLRDIGGIIVIDFIDMVLESNRDLVVRRLLECLGRDRTKHQVAEVTSLGLVQMTRKRVGAGLIEVFSEPCERCNGRGILVHSEPIDRPPAADTAAGGNRTGRARRTRGGSPGGQVATEAVPEKPAGNGPTPAQMAAAAYAAAVQASGHADMPAQPAGLSDADGSAEPPLAPDWEPPAHSQPVPADEGVRAEEPAVVQSAPTPRRRRGRVMAPAGPPRAAVADQGDTVQPAERLDGPADESPTGQPVESDGDLGASEPVH